uniref:Uncharacterized protein n=1 Tax=Candidatus Kentrum sp. FM TaxID=2126340 RepID=A0A450TP38_9GAMM|nr:MAG: hypothetical protein BECKFM1743C_GA0114222_105282 [Candidatus Kentron sp. FM]
MPENTDPAQKKTDLDKIAKLLDFMKAFRPGPKKEKKPQGGGV